MEKCTHSTPNTHRRDKPSLVRFCPIYGLPALNFPPVPVQPSNLVKWYSRRPVLSFACRELCDEKESFLIRVVVGEPSREVGRDAGLVHENPQLRSGECEDG